MSIYKKLHEMQSATRSLSANAEGQTGSARYGYISGSKLLGVIRPMMDKYGLLLTQEIVGIENIPTTYMTRNGEKTEMFTSLHIRFTWIDVDDGSTMTNDFFANGMNSWDKGLGSALTYAERYYLLKTFHIATDEDDVDAIIRDEDDRPATTTAVTARRKAASREKKSPAPVQDPAPVSQYKPASEEVYWKCVEAYAKGIPCKSGKDCRTYWIELTNPEEIHIKEFDRNVDNVRIANGITL